MAKAGRPKGTNNKDTIVSLRLDSEMRKRLDAYCKKKKIKKSEALRGALEEAMKKTMSE